MLTERLFWTQRIESTCAFHLQRNNSDLRFAAVITSSKHRVVIITFYQNPHTIDNKFLLRWGLRSASYSFMNATRNPKRNLNLPSVLKCSKLFPKVPNPASEARIADPFPLPKKFASWPHARGHAPWAKSFNEVYTSDAGHIGRNDAGTKGTCLWVSRSKSIHWL